MPSQNNIVMNISTMFEGLKGDSKQKLDSVAKLFAKTFDKFAQPLGINIDKNSIKTIEDLETKFRQLGVTATQVGNQISLSMKAADGKFISTSYAYEGGIAGKGKAKFTQGTTVQSASYLKPTEQLKRNYENVIKARKELDSLEQKGFNKTSETWQQAEQSVKEYNTQLYDTIEALKQRYNLTVDIDRDKDKIVWGNGKGQLETMGRKYQYGIEYSKTKAQDTAAIQAEAKALQENTQKVREYVSALQTQYREEEKLVRLQQAKAPKQVIQAQQEVVDETKRQTQGLFNQVNGTEELNQVQDKLILSEKKHKQTLSELTNTTQKSVTLFGKFKATLKQVIEAGLSWKIFSAITQTFEKTIDTVTELDKSLVDLQIATGSTRVQAEELLSTYNQMAKELGTTTTKVADSANTWLRQGYSIEDTNLLIEQSTILAKVGMLEEAEAAKYLTSALKGYKLEAGDASRIIDMATKLDLQAAVDTGQLFEALSRTANLAHEVGVEMNQALAMISAGMEVTQQDAGSFGNALKTLFSRMSNVAAGKTIDDLGESLNDVEKSLNANGIALRNSANEWRDYYEVLDEIYSKMQSGELEGVALSQVTTALGGTRQREAILTVLQNWDKVRKYAASALDSVGTSAEKYNAYLQSIQAAQEKLKATFEDFSQALVDSGIIKGFYDLGQGLLSFLTMIIQIKPLIPSLLLLLEFKALKYGIQNWAKLTKHLNLFKNSFPALKKAIEIFSHSMKAGNSVGQSFSYTLDQMKASAYGAQMGTVALSLAITAATAAIAIGISLYQKQQQQIQENIDQAKEHITAIKEEQESLEDLKQQYIVLSKSENYNDETRKSIQSIQEEINKLVGKEADGIDLVNGKLDDQLKKLEGISFKKAQDSLEELYGNVATLRQNLGKNLFSPTEGYNIFGLKGDAAALIEAMHNKENWMKRFSKIGSTMYSSNSNMSIEEAKALLEEYIELRNEIDPDVENQAWNAADKAIKELTKRIDDYNQALNNYNKTQAIAKIGADLFNNKVKIDSKEAYDSYIESLKKAKDENGNLLYTEEAIQAMIEVLSEKFPQYSDKIDTSSNSTSNFTESLKDLKEKLQSAKEAYEVLNSAIDEYNSNGSISYDTWQKLINLEDQYLSVLIDENGQIKANNEALQDLMKAQIEEITLKRMEQYVDNLLTAAQKGKLDAILLSTEGLGANTEARLRNIMAIIASNPELMKNSKVILQNLSAMAQLTSSISLGSDSTKDATDATEDWEKVLDYANKVLDDHIDKLEKEREAIEKSIEEQIKAKEKEIELLEAEKEALEDKNEEKNKEIELEELQRNLQKAKQRTMRVYRAELDTWVWEQDPEAVQEAQKELDDFYTEQKIDDIDKRIEALEKEVEALEKTTDEEEESYDKRLKLLNGQIKKAEEYKKKWNSVKTDYEHAQNEITSKARLGADAEKGILEGRITTLNIFKDGYTKALSAVAKETENSAKRINTALGSFNFEEMKKMLNEMNLAGKTKTDFTYDARNRGTVIETGASGERFMKIGTNQWVKMSDVKHLGGSGYQIKKDTQMYVSPYASGTLSAKSGLANVDEKGNELIIPRQGRYRMMEYGDTVVPHNLSQRLFDVASNPLRFITNALNSVKSPNLITSSNQTSNQSIIHIGTVELPSVTNGENFIKQLQLIAANR